MKYKFFPLLPSKKLKWTGGISWWTSSGRWICAVGDDDVPRWIELF